MNKDEKKYLPAEDDDDDLTPLGKPISEQTRKSISKIKKDAQQRVARREKLNIRFSEEEILLIYAAAERKEVAVMPMLRQWVLRALEQEDTVQKNVKNAESPGSLYEPVAGEQRRVSSQPPFSVAEGYRGTPSDATPSVSALQSTQLSSITDALHHLAEALHDAGFVVKDRTSK